MDNTSTAISIDPIDAHEALWTSSLPLLSPQSLPQALMLLGPKHAQMRTFAYRWIATVFCEQVQAPCGRCRSCEAIQQGFHPDLQVITQEEGASSIKIEQIRILQETIYQTPSWQSMRFVLLFPIDSLNLAASNALLKILEEPPRHLKFILVSEHYQVLPTLLSRCQRLFFDTSESFTQLDANYLNIAAHYPKTSSRYQLKAAEAEFSNTLQRLFNEELDICQAALQWKKTELDDFLWFFYLFIATSIAQLQFGAPEAVLDSRLLHTLCDRFKQPMHLYAVLDKVMNFMRISRQNITLNHDLVVESLFLSMIEASYAYT